jgi:nitrate reductase (NAD(P)H)
MPIATSAHNARTPKITPDTIEVASDRLPPTPPESTIAETECLTPGNELEFPLPPPRIPPTKVLDVDKSTPDQHVPRDSRLIRLTGVHPFNVEPPLTDLFNEGFLTSPELFYVRNHGAVPEVKDNEVLDWTFTIEGYNF